MKDLKEYYQYEDIPYSGTMECPQCYGSGIGSWRDSAKLVGWCSTERGYMMVFECPHCFQKFRYHGCMDERWDWERFKLKMEKYYESTR